MTRIISSPQRDILPLRSISPDDMSAFHQAGGKLIMYQARGSATMPSWKRIMDHFAGLDVSHRRRHCACRNSIRHRPCDGSCTMLHRTLVGGEGADVSLHGPLPHTHPQAADLA